jgi:hypothetical protein
MNFKRNQVKKKFGIVRGKDGRFKRGYRYIQLLFVRTAEEMVEEIPQGHSNIYWSNLNWGVGWDNDISGYKEDIYSYRTDYADYVTDCRDCGEEVGKPHEVMGYPS